MTLRDIDPEHIDPVYAEPLLSTESVLLLTDERTNMYMSNRNPFVKAETSD